MKISIKYLLIILGALAILFFVVQYTKRGNKSRSLKTNLVVFDVSDVSRLEITTYEDTVLLQKEKDRWTLLLNGENKNTKEGVVETVLNTLKAVEPSRLASRKEEKWKEYGVDTTGTRVKVFDGKKILSDLILGRFGVEEGQRDYHTFVRLFNDTDVYVASNFMKMTVYQNPNDYRDSRVLKINKDSLTSIAFEYGNESFELIKNTQWEIENQSVDSSQVADYLQAIRNLTSNDFYKGEVSTSSTGSITFKFTSQPEVSVEVHTSALAPIIKSSENKYEIFSSQELYEKIFVKQAYFFNAE